MVGRTIVVSFSHS